MALTPTKSWNDPETHYLEALNSDWYALLQLLLSEFSVSTTEFYKEEGFVFSMLPLTTGAVSSPMGLGSDSIPVQVEIAGEKTYLADSMQFLLEYTCRLADSGTYYIAPSFRGEPADSTHLSQFYHSEAELKGGLEDVICLVERYLRHLTEYFYQNYATRISEITDNVDHLEHFLKLAEIPRCTFDEAVELLGDNSKLIEDHGKYRTITNQGELELIKHFGGFVWLTHFDTLSVPFYQKVSNNRKSAICADLLMGIGETVGAGERHESFQQVQDALDLHGVSQGEYEWYLGMKEHYPLQTAGFGMGIERFMLWLLKHNDIRDIPLVPRFNGEVSKI